MRLLRRDQRHALIDLRPRLRMTRIGDDDDACAPAARGQHGTHIGQQKIAVREAPRADPAMSGEGDEQQIASA
jgi:hypothetical protein